MSDCLGEIAFHSSGEVYRDGVGGGRGWGVSRLWTVPMDPACTSQRWSQWEGIPSSFSPENPASYTAMDTVLIESQLNRIWGVTHFFLIS